MLTFAPVPVFRGVASVSLELADAEGFGAALHLLFFDFGELIGAEEADATEESVDFLSSFLLPLPDFFGVSSLQPL